MRGRRGEKITGAGGHEVTGRTDDQGGIQGGRAPCGGPTAGWVDGCGEEGSAGRTCAVEGLNGHEGWKRGLELEGW